MSLEILSYTHNFQCSNKSLSKRLYKCTISQPTKIIYTLIGYLLFPAVTRKLQNYRVQLFFRYTKRLLGTVKDIEKNPTVICFSRYQNHCMNIPIMSLLCYLRYQKQLFG